MATVRPHDERRRFSRITFQRPAVYTMGGASCTVTVIDVSLKGALLEVPAGLVAPQGTRCTLLIHLDQGGEASIHLDGQVAHHGGARLGMRCTSVDLESVGHLRRVVELNLGDDELLHRELATLIGMES
jgi:hypothetical protein